MIIGYSFFNEVDYKASNFWDTAIPTSELDNLTIGQGIYDEMLMSVDTDINKSSVKPNDWNIRYLINPKFQKSLEAGSISASGHKITQLQIYRRALGENEERWLLIGQFGYDTDFNIYSFIDITAKSGVTYEYALVPVADTVVGETTISAPTRVDYSGVFISDLQNNYKLDMDFSLGQVSYNRNSSELKPLNSQFPVMVYGAQNYRSGEVNFLPVSDTQVKTGGTVINGKEELDVRDKLTGFLNNGQAKVLRNDNGDIMIVAVTDVNSTPKENLLMDIHSVSFKYTEIGKIESGTLARTGLIGAVTKSNYSFGESGEIIWEI